MRFFLLICILACARFSYAEFTIRVDEQTQRYTILDVGNPVLTYNYGIVPVPEGITGKYAVQRSNYIHPLYGPNGEVLTADYQKDHAHHRGIYWAWPEVSYKGEKRDLHALQGVFARPVRMIRQEASKDSATLEAEHVWKWGDTEEIVKELATISVTPAKNGLRIIDFQFRLEGLKPDVSIARRQQSAYGGLNMRMSARKEQQITQHIGNAALFPQEAWAELVGIPPDGKEPVGVFLLQKPTNPVYPCDWQDYPDLNWLQPTFPSKGMAFALPPGKPLDLAYRLIIRSGKGLKQEPATLFTEYAKNSADPLASLVHYKLGESRLAMTAFEESIKKVPPSQHKAIEQRLLKLLAGAPSPDFKRWACRQLLVVGSPSSIPTVTPYLKEEGWMEACDVLLSLPGEQGIASLLQALPTLDNERRATLLHAVGLCHPPSAVPTLATYASDPDIQTSSAALLALSGIQDPSAAEALLGLKPTTNNAFRIIEAKLANATLQRENAHKKGKALFESVYLDTTLPAHYRAAALLGLTASNPKELSATVVNALQDKEAHLRHAAITSLGMLETSTCEQLRTSFKTFPKETQLAILSLWAKRNISSTEPEVLACLKSADDDLKLAAVVALRKMGTATAVPELLIVAAGGGPLAKETESTLQQMQGDSVIKALKKGAVEQDTPQSTSAVKALAARMDPGCIAFLLDVVAGSDIKKAEIALITIKNQATADDLPQLKKLLQEKPELKENLAQAIIAICKRQQNPKVHLSTFLTSPIKAEVEQQIKALSMTNLAVGKSITASHPCQEPLKPELAIDNNPETYWSCAFSPSWIQVDLEALGTVSRIKIVNYVDGMRYYQYRVEVSPDAKQWTCVGDMSQNTAPATKEGVTFDFKEVVARYVRVTMLKNSANPGMHISELSIYGEGGSNK
jgi:HEAT repeat protein